ncbi:MAG TPA: hypothetical protein PKD54_10585 [Pirellulaceae bacterium]|nr:hypothetical protein [Pirellulaceae bacterium]
MNLAKKSRSTLRGVDEISKLTGIKELAFDAEFRENASFEQHRSVSSIEQVALAITESNRDTDMSPDRPIACDDVNRTVNHCHRVDIIDSCADCPN